MAESTESDSITSARSSVFGTSDGLATRDIIGPGTNEVHVDTFIDTWLPEVPGLEGRTFDIILGALMKTTGYNRIVSKAFPRKGPRLAAPKRDVCECLQSIVTATQTVVSRFAPQLQATTQFTAAPSSLNKGDVQFVYQDPTPTSKSSSHWFNTVACGHIRGSDSLENMRKSAGAALSSMEQVMCKDPRRRRAFSFTINHRAMRLWYCDRSQIVTTEPFDFLEQPTHFIRFVLALLYAPYENLGFDSTIKIYWDSDHDATPQFLITIQSRTNSNDVREYKTMELLSDASVRNIRGRGTRVWKVREWKEGRVFGEPLVLKDCWVNSSSDVEGATVARIHASATTNAERTELEGALLTTVIDGKVILGDGTVDRTVADPSSVSRPTKDHYRIVFKEVCETLRDATNLASALETIAMATKALQLLHSLGWVHRDISTGNILRFGDGVKLCDFEYAKNMAENKDKTISDSSIGTPDFMAIEVVDRLYTFGQPNPSRRNNRRRVIENIMELVEAAECDIMTFQPAPPRPPRTPPCPETWFYNPLHDLESILWIVLMFLFTKDVAPEPRPESCSHGKLPDNKRMVESDERRSDRIVEYFNFSHPLFVNHSGRVKIMFTNILSEHLRLHPLHPAISPLSVPVENMLGTLITAYEQAEEDTAKIDHTCAADVHDAFGFELQRCIKFLHTLPVNIVLRSLCGEAAKLPLSSRLRLCFILDPPESYKDTKRSRDNDGDDGGGRPSKRPRRHGSVSGSPRPIVRHGPFANTPTRQRPDTVEKPVVALTNGRVLRYQTRSATTAARAGATRPEVGLSSTRQSKAAKGQTNVASATKRRARKR